MPVFTGTSANELFNGGPDADSISGGGGFDTLVGGGGGDVIYSAGIVAAFTLPYSGNPYSLPVLDGGIESDSLEGGDGGDIIYAGYGDQVDGGAGFDLLFISFRGAPSGVTADFNQATQIIGGGVITGIEAGHYIEGSEYADRLTLNGAGGGFSGASFASASGGGGDDTITAGYTTGSLFGDEGNDVLDGRSSQYLMQVYGGAGNDTIYTNNNTTARASGGAGNDTIMAHGLTHGDAGDDVIVMQWTYYAGLVYGDDGNDSITAASSANRISGGAGLDTIIGHNGADALFSGDFSDDLTLERDVINGGGGADELSIGYGDDADGGAGTDTLRLSLAGGSGGVDFSTAGIVAGTPFSFGGGTIQNVETLLYLRGTEFADTLRLQTQAQRLTVDAGSGDDVIISQASSVAVAGGAGNDRFISGSAADSFDGGVGHDTVDYSATSTAVTVNLKTGAGHGGDTLTSVESVMGSAFGDILIGSAGGSTLSGGAGADRLEVGTRDVVISGDGVDLIYVTLGSHTASTEAGVVTVNDWTAGDQLQFGSITGAYTELTASSYAAATTAADVQAAAGYNFVSVQVGADTFVFGNALSGRHHFDDSVRLAGVGLDAVSAGNIGLAGALETPVTPQAPPPPPPPTPTPPTTPTTPPTPGAPTTPTTPTAPPVTPTTPDVAAPSSAAPNPNLPAAPAFVLTGSNGQLAGNMHARLADALEAEITDESDTHVDARIGNGLVLHVEGSGFSTAAEWDSGIVTLLSYSADAAHGGPLNIYMTIPPTSLAALAGMMLRDATFELFSTIFAGNDRIVGGVTPQLWAFGGDDLIYTNANTDTVWAGAGNDVIDARAPGPTVHSHYLRGEDGNDYILGGNGFDDINGNRGRDTASGGDGEDWVVGGQDDDLLFGDNAFDIVYGNLGNDTVSGGNGNDWVRGGQGDDLLLGGSGNDFMSGDRGNDTIWGGTGADQFNLVSGAAVDRVMDFNAAEGDFVVIEGNLPYALSFVDGDAVIDIGNGDRMTLVGVSNSSLLGANWLH